VLAEKAKELKKTGDPRGYKIENEETKKKTIYTREELETLSHAKVLDIMIAKDMPLNDLYPTANMVNTILEHQEPSAE